MNSDNYLDRILLRVERLTNAVRAPIKQQSEEPIAIRISRMQLHGLVASKLYPLAQLLAEEPDHEALFDLIVAEVNDAVNYVVRVARGENIIEDEAGNGHYAILGSQIMAGKFVNPNADSKDHRQNILDAMMQEIGYWVDYLDLKRTPDIMLPR